MTYYSYADRKPRNNSAVQIKIEGLTQTKYYNCTYEKNNLGAKFVIPGTKPIIFYPNEITSWGYIKEIK